MQVMNSQNRAFVLASGSPRRLELTRRIGFEPLVRVSTIPEQREASEAPETYARRLAGEKARDVARQIADDVSLPGWILSADTIVVHDRRVLEKPVDEDDAFRMIRELSGARHEVITAFAWLWRAPGRPAAERVEQIESAVTSVWLRELSDEMIHRYVATGEPMDKAGSYGIQDIGGTLVRRLEGSYFCVVGLPVCQVVDSLQQLGGLDEYPFSIPTRGDDER